MLLSALITTFINNLLPILLVSSAGFLLGRLLKLEPRPLSRIVFYLFGPVLVFNLLIHSELEADQTILTIAFSGAVTLLTAAISFLLGKAFRLEKPLLIAVILTTAFGNNGNYGLPLISFAFGEQALAYGTLYFVTNSVMFNTLGVLLASLGNMQPRQALLGLLRVPTMYTIPLAILVNALNLTLPISVARTIDLAAAATIPLMLVLLGLELTRVQWSHSLRAMSLAVVIRLLVVPAIGFLLALPFGLQGASRQGNLLQTGMPGAVAATIAASEYELEPELVTAIIFTGTVISPLTLTPLLVLLGS